ncbi:hypothetical protein ACVWZ8_004760 [Arthrobacter sp. UYCu723]
MQKPTGWPACHGRALHRPGKLVASPALIPALMPAAGGEQVGPEQGSGPHPGARIFSPLHLLSPRRPGTKIHPPIAPNPTVAGVYLPRAPLQIQMPPDERTELIIRRDFAPPGLAA